MFEGITLAILSHSSTHSYPISPPPPSIRATATSRRTRTRPRPTPMYVWAWRVTLLPAILLHLFVSPCSPPLLLSFPPCPSGGGAARGGRGQLVHGRLRVQPRLHDQQRGRAQGCVGGCGTGWKEVARGVMRYGVQEYLLGKFIDITAYSAHRICSRGGGVREAQLVHPCARHPKGGAGVRGGYTVEVWGYMVEGWYMVEGVYTVDWCVFYSIFPSTAADAPGACRAAAARGDQGGPGVAPADVAQRARVLRRPPVPLHAW